MAKKNVFALSQALLSLCLVQYHSFLLSDIDYKVSGVTYLITRQGKNLSLPERYTGKIQLSCEIRCIFNVNIFSICSPELEVTMRNRFGATFEGNL